MCISIRIAIGPLVAPGNVGAEVKSGTSERPRTTAATIAKVCAVEDHGDDRRDNGEDDRAADVGERRELRVVGDERAADEVDEHVGEDSGDDRTEADKRELPPVDRA